MHEIAHRFFCDLSDVPVYEVNYWHLGGGHVIHGEVNGIKSAVLISVGPLIVNTFLCALLTLPACLPMWFLNADLGGFDMVLLWVGLSIGMHAFPSNHDMDNLKYQVSNSERSGLGGWLLYFIAGTASVIFMIANALRFFWFDLIYAVGISMIIPAMLVANGTGADRVESMAAGEKIELRIPGVEEPVLISQQLIESSKRAELDARKTMDGTKLAKLLGDKLGLNNEGVRSLNAGRHEEAVMYFLAALDADPDYEIASENLAVAHNNWGLSLREKNPDGALNQFECAYFIDPTNKVTQANLNGMTRYMNYDPDKFEDRVKLAEKAIERGSKVGAIVEYELALKIKKDRSIKKKVDKLRKKLDEQRQSKSGSN